MCLYHRGLRAALNPRFLQKGLILCPWPLLSGLLRELWPSPGVAGALGIPAREKEEPFSVMVIHCPPETPQMLERRRNRRSRNSAGSGGSDMTVKGGVGLGDHHTPLTPCSFAVRGRVRPLF